MNEVNAGTTRSPMLRSALDHLVITAGSRERGAAHLAALLGVALREGGEHPRMGTHNALLRLGEAAYLEVIAVNPQAPAPARPRWFELDRDGPDAQPRLATWVVRTNDIHRASGLTAAPLGQVEAMTRGSLSWHITIPSDGHLPWGGVIPTILQWSTPSHPATLLPDMGCSLEALEIRHANADRLESMLTDIGFDGPVELGRPSSGRPAGLSARIQTPGGVVLLGGA